MGKIRAQKKGANLRYRSVKRRRKGRHQYKEGEGTIVDIIHAVGRPLMKIKHKDENFLMIAPEGVAVGDKVKFGKDVEVKNGNVLPLEKIPESIPIFNIEGVPGDNGSFVKSSGNFAFVVSHGKKCVVRLPSKKTKEFDPKCRATIGTPAGSGRVDKVFVKAGIKHFAMKAKGKLYPIVSGTAMNPVDHPFGGKTKPGIHKTVARNTPPGAKVGSIAPKRTGKRKRK